MLKMITKVRIQNVCSFQLSFVFVQDVCLRASEASEFSLMRQRGTLSVHPCVRPCARPCATTPTSRGNRL